MKKIVIISGILIVIAIAGFILFRGNGNEPKFRTDKIIRGDIEMAVTATGTVNPVTTVLVGTQVSGTIKKLYVDFNSPVKKGQLIARIDPALFEAQVNQAKANLLSAKANLEKAKATLVDAKRTMDRNKELFSKNLVARSDLDTAETNYETADASVIAAKSQVAQTEAALNLAGTNLRYTKIVSPVDGIVVSRNVDVGQTVAASFQTPTLFTIAQDLTKMQIDTSVDEADIGKIKVGQDVEFTVDAYPDITFKGRVWQIRNAPITVQNVVTYDVVINVDNPELKLKPGMTANVSIIVSIKKDVLKIPNAALRFKPAEKGKTAVQPKGSGVWILEQGKLKRLPISIGISDGNYTELVSGGIKEGQELIVESLTKSKTQTPSGPRMF
ncbi:MAG: efflux RND transporter periplasmic adaptor subunit [Nitrospirae bacterium CG_4_10_14_0_8_um_filter_41_23]|nr:efflux RND transporter periplasmic adaptor subunit [Nitrospirota bacterium]OIP61535.1 MAG: efflux transporter periplasmic adaptor subunit [Nitrospirae bacterium CG2_30_41_42]PIQ94821.1 MAG: efflux transporter periplasmic adaptor subunit [Nitrospirae bacterium CG11_big_fil_rev_8_21_14_0_20_41_14]PIV43298.1 MAG: efflux RND transporter periplasmic adaptor subunit [Nitrospirae bacterium CG02_land_8_20_14_3_00_41_53]PIW87728.1 MAG: efflux RND transporter periplasmic adaptor subunit [Nitrospirae b